MGVYRHCSAAILSAVFSLCANADAIRYSRDILPILAENCFNCHGADRVSRKADLRLDTEAGAKAVLESGLRPAGADRASSAVYQHITATNDDQMPPAGSGKSLTPAQIEIIGQWLDAGATWEGHWAYTPPVETTPPPAALSSWIRGPIDAHILARLEAEGIQPSPEAERRTLVRRLYFDLTGLPPEPAAVERFVLDNRPEAYERLVDELLASPHYGEKWGRWWLDLAMYGDSDGYLSDFLRLTAWRYREWVVGAFNLDLPFEQFTIEQLAGDLLPDATVDQRMATGFLRNTLSNREGGADLEEFRTLQVIDRTKSIGTVWLGLTVECAQCHDHKYDAVSQKEFFQLYSFFNNAEEVNIDAPLGKEAEAMAAVWPDYVAKREALLAPVAAELEALQAEWEAKMLWAAVNPGGPDARWDRQWEVLGLIWGQGDGNGEGEGQLEGCSIVQTPVPERTKDEKFRLQDYFFARGDLVNPDRFVALKVPELVKQIEEIKQALPRVSRAQSMRVSRVTRPNQLFIRGDFRVPGDQVSPGTPGALPALTSNAPDRLDLARWLVAPENPLTARVTVNRIWQELFGKGIVFTSGDFGVRGALPSHPDLLDWLAIEFQRQGWSMKGLIRTIVLSSTYRQSSDARPELTERDPGNMLLARQNRLRLGAEQVRDAALATSGLLNPTMGGPSVRPPQPDSVTEQGFDNKWVADEGPNRYRRALYTFIQRTSPFGQLVNFDYPDVNRSCTRRERSNTPLQALNLLNDPTFFEAAQALAGRVLADSDDRATRLKQLFATSVARPPSPAEQLRLLALLDEETARFTQETEAIADVTGANDAIPRTPEGAAWVIAASVVLNLDEFITRE
jgi:hypothetical protein